MAYSFLLPKGIFFIDFPPKLICSIIVLRQKALNTRGTAKFHLGEFALFDFGGQDNLELLINANEDIIFKHRNKFLFIKDFE